MHHHCKKKCRRQNIKYTRLIIFILFRLSSSEIRDVSTPLPVQAMHYQPLRFNFTSIGASVRFKKKVGVRFINLKNIQYFLIEVYRKCEPIFLSNLLILVLFAGWTRLGIYIAIPMIFQEHF